MTSRFARLEQRVSDTVDRLNAEAMELEPRAAGEYASAADPDRAGYAFVGVVDFKPHVALPIATGSRKNDVASIAGDHIHVSINVKALPADRGQWPKVGDFILLPDRPEENRKLQISIVEPDGMSRILCRCMRAK